MESKQFPGYIWNNWQNLMVHPPQTPKHEKITTTELLEKLLILRFAEMTCLSNKSKYSILFVQIPYDFHNIYVENQMSGKTTALYWCQKAYIIYSRDLYKSTMDK